MIEIIIGGVIFFTDNIEVKTYSSDFILLILTTSIMNSNK